MSRFNCKTLKDLDIFVEKLLRAKKNNSEFQNFVVTEMIQISDLLALKHGKNDKRPDYLLQLFNSFTKKL